MAWKMRSLSPSASFSTLCSIILSLSPLTNAFFSAALYWGTVQSSVQGG
eukprot:CAMPEP_0182457664 /NCGR_PEP_ID=MMETSP1319-20130603/3191_1 /TAXON_ID=172717 /ORGANISM="Bolidomonas pacifica, Strain RCC208" /LENGTH=48 /DNA_ID= /DNA_START= /DNA_END= /DNA_ORIENTATION=